ncbi:licheninase [Flavobacteriaceae bacterium UJ101]|nr:licheninase [Flavobacteriaceae bacterium UJ101]
MKNRIFLIKLGLILCVTLLWVGCNDDKNYELGQVVVPTGTIVNAVVSTDGSGLTSFEVSGDNVITYKVDFGDGTTGVFQSSTFSKNYGSSGTYVVTVTPYGVAGVSGDVATTTLTIEVDFSLPETFIQNLTGGSSKIWYWDVATAGYLGVGPGDAGEPVWYTSSPYEHEAVGCMFDDMFVFSYDAINEKVTYNYNNIEASYFNTDFTPSGSDECVNVDTSGDYEAVLGLATSDVLSESESTKVNIALTGSGEGNFMGYFAGGDGNYEVISLTASTMYVRWVDSAGRAWYQKFTTTEPGSGSGGDSECASGETGVVPDGTYTLIWQDEFNVDGAPCSENWTFDIGTGDNGWGNAEEQYYTDREDNVIVENGFLKITAKKEDYQGSNYTSARLKTQGIFDFKYGKVDIHAKLPEGVGTWPAFWMLGSNFDTVGWPACGEIDIMEHVGVNQEEVLSTLHYPNFSGGSGPGGKTTVSDVSNKFHTYSIEWDESWIKFSIDGYPVHFQFQNESSLPFNQNFFLILNIAMGGTLGGTIDSNFSESTMEIDFIRVFQK